MTRMPPSVTQTCPSCADIFNVWRAVLTLLCPGCGTTFVNPLAGPARAVETAAADAGITLPCGAAVALAHAALAHSDQIATSTVLVPGQVWDDPGHRANILGGLEGGIYAQLISSAHLPVALPACTVEQAEGAPGFDMRQVTVTIPARIAPAAPPYPA